jgi:hypothetical protein
VESERVFRYQIQEIIYKFITLSKSTNRECLRNLLWNISFWKPSFLQENVKSLGWTNRTKNNQKLSPFLAFIFAFKRFFYPLHFVTGFNYSLMPLNFHSTASIRAVQVLSRNYVLLNFSSGCSQRRDANSYSLRVALLYV